MREAKLGGKSDDPDDPRAQSRRARHNATKRQSRRQQSWLVPLIVVGVSIPLLLWAWSVLSSRRAEAALAPSAMAGAYQLDQARRLASLLATGGKVPPSAEPYLRIHLAAEGGAVMTLGLGDATRVMRGTWTIERARIRLSWTEEPAAGMFVVTDGAVGDGVLEFRHPDHGELVFVKGPYAN